MTGKDQSTFIKDPVARKRFWFGHVRVYLAGGKTAQQYCKDARVSFYSLRDWQTKFKNEHSAEWMTIVEGAKKRATVKRATAKKKNAQFVEVKLDEGEASEPEVAERTSAWEISTPGGFKITMPADSNISEVVALIRRLREEQC